MLNNLLSIVANPDGNYYFDNRFGEACIYALIGFMIVFLGIVLIIGIIWLVGLIMRKTDNLSFLTAGKKNKAKDNAESDAQDNAVVQSDEIPDEVKAAIMAAIMAYYDAEKPQCEFIVKRIRKI